MNELLTLDRALFLWVNGGNHPVLLDQAFVWITHPPGRLVLFFVLTLAVIARYREQALRPLLVLVLAVTLADRLCADVIKPLVGRVRPCFTLPDVHLLLPRQPHSPSFPSNHAANAFAAATALWPLRGTLRWAAYAVAALVGFSRVYVGVHYPSDVVVGALIGTALAFCVRKILSQFWRTPASARPQAPDAGGLAAPPPEGP